MLRFHPARRLTRRDVAAVAAVVSRRIERLLQRRGLITAPEEIVVADRWTEESPSLAGLAAAVQLPHRLELKDGRELRQWLLELLTRNNAGFFMSALLANEPARSRSLGGVFRHGISCDVLMTGQPFARGPQEKSQRRPLDEVLGARFIPSARRLFRQPLDWLGNAASMGVSGESLYPSRRSRLDGLMVRRRP